MSATHDHPDFANVVRVPRFHQAPQRIQYLIDQPDNVIVLPVIRIERPRGRPAGPSGKTTGPPH